MKRSRYSAVFWVGLAAAGVYFGSGRESVAARKRQEWRVPVVMEESTVRGKVVVLETRSEDRQTIEGLRIQVWTYPDKAKGERRGRLIYETKTDKDGFFSLPEIKRGDYRLVVGELLLRLMVYPKSQPQEEPKILLILLPKEVI